MRFPTTLLIIVLLSSCLSEEGKRDKYFAMGNQALAEGRHQNAIQAYQISLKAAPDFKEALNNLGVAYMEQGSPHEAIQQYNEAIAIDGTYWESIHNRAQAYDMVGNYDKSLADYGVLVSAFPDSVLGYFGSGLVQTKLAEYDNAFRSFQKVLAIDPNDTEALVNLGTVEYYRGNFDAAIDVLNRALAQLKEANAYNTLNQVYLSQGRWEEAMIAINNALDLEPEAGYFLNNRGLTYLMMDSLAQGLKDINVSIVLEPENMWAIRNKGIYYLRSGNPNQAVEYLERVVASGEFVEDVYYYLGQAYLERGDKDDACATWSRGVEANERKSQDKMQLCI